MSKSKPVAKKVKQNKVNVWGEIKFFFSTLFSNDRCVEARKKPWWSAVIIAILSVFLAILPISITYLSQDGASFFNSPLYGYETALVDFDTQLHDKNVSMKISNGNLTVTGWDEAFTDMSGSYNVYLHSYWKDVTELPSTTVTDSNGSTTTVVGDTPETVSVKVVDFAAYYLDMTIAEVTSATTNPITAILGGSDPAGNATYSINCIFFLKDGLAAYKLPTGSSSSKLSYSGKWNHESFEGFDLADLYSKDVDGNAYVDANDNVITTANVSEYTTATVNSWKLLFHNAYESTRVSSGWNFTGIYTAVFIGLTLVLGLTIFLMTRGKQNPFRIYTFWECQKIAYWSSLTPALLAMILSFLFSSYSVIFFIFLFGMRVMWMSMRSLRPQQ